MRVFQLRHANTYLSVCTDLVQGVRKCKLVNTGRRNSTNNHVQITNATNKSSKLAAVLSATFRGWMNPCKQSQAEQITEGYGADGDVLMNIDGIIKRKIWKLHSVIL